MSPLLAGTTIALYLIALLTLAFISGRKANNRDFFTGGRGFHWSLVGVAMIGAAISGVTFISVPGSVATNAFSYLQMVLGFIVGNILITTILIPLFYKLNVVSLYEYLQERFGGYSHKCGAWFFFISKTLSASLRAFIVPAVLQPLLFEPLGIPFWVNATLTMLFVWLYTYRGGVKSVIWGDILKSVCLIGSVVLTIIFIVKELNLSSTELVDAIATHEYSQVFFFDDINDKRYFFKQFFAGVFMIIATTGLDQDLMQRVLGCRSQRESQRNMLLSIVLQSVIIFLLLTLGVLLYTYLFKQGYSQTFPLSNGESIISHPDQIFGAVASMPTMPAVVGVLFVLGVASTTYTSTGSALTALTTAFTVDIVNGRQRNNEKKLTSLRKWIHTAIALIMTGIIVAIYHFGDDSIINTFYRVASYTYGPLLGMFTFGIISKRKVRDRYIPIVAILSPIATWVLDHYSKSWFGGYEFSFELLIVNALFTAIGLYILSLNNGIKDEKQ